MFIVRECPVASLDTKQASNMSLVELLPTLVDRIKRLLCCDRASIFLRSEDGEHDQSMHGKV